MTDFRRRRSCENGSDFAPIDIFWGARHVDRFSNEGYSRSKIEMISKSQRKDDRNKAVNKWSRNNTFSDLVTGQSIFRGYRKIQNKENSEQKHKF